MDEFVINAASPAIVTNQGLEQAVSFFSEQTCRHLLVLADPYMVQIGLADALKKLAGTKLSVTLFSDFQGEPKIGSTQKAVDLARAAGADAVLGIGGGSALDMAKIVKTCLNGGQDVSHYLMQANPLPENRDVLCVVIPTTAGTGSEASGTNIITLENGHKGWVWGPQTKPDLVILDPGLTVSLPPDLTVWTGMDALVHAFEAATNHYTHPGAQLYAHEALRICRTSLPLAVQVPESLSVRRDMLLASYYAGRAIDMVSCSIAHALSHALASLGPIHHGLATALGFEASLPFVVAADTNNMRSAARAFGVFHLADLPDIVSGFMTELNISRALPPAFADKTADDLLAVLLAEEMQPMRQACRVWAEEADLASFAATLFDPQRAAA